ncbi:unnamed protein product [Gordionus sp. m RMFG-2023]
MENLISSSAGSEVDFESDDDYLYNSNHNSETEEDNIDIMCVKIAINIVTVKMEKLNVIWNALHKKDKIP